MAISLNDLDQILGYDVATHSVKGVPSLASSAPHPAMRNIPAIDIGQTTGVSAPNRALQPIRPAPEISASTAAPGIPNVGGSPNVAPPSSIPLPMNRMPSVGPSVSPGANPEPGKRNFWQKLGHGLAEAGNIAGDVLIPNVMTNIPGTQRHNEFEEARQARLAGEQARTGAEQEATEAAKRENELVPWGGQMVSRKEWVPLEEAREREEAAEKERQTAQEAEAARQQTGIEAGEKRETEREAATEKGRQEAEAAQEKGRQESESAQAAALDKRLAAEGAMLDKRLAAQTAKTGEEPVYAYDPKTKQTVQTTPSEAKASGYTNIMKVNAAQIDKDKLLGSDLNDIQLNLSNYRNAIAAQGHLSPTDRQAESEAINQGGFKAGAFGVQIPTDWLNKLYNSSAFNRLRDEQKSAVVAFYRAQEMIPAYQRVLTNSGRSQEKAMEIAMQSVPTPIMDEGTANKMLDGFQQNVDQVGQRQVRLPGIDSHQDVRKRVEAEWKGPTNRGGGGNAPARPANVPENYTFNANGPRGAGWYKP